MNLILSILSRLGLALTIIPPILFLTDTMSLDTIKLALAIGAILWFATAPFIQKQRQEDLIQGEH